MEKLTSIEEGRPEEESLEEKRSEELLTVFDCERITKKKVSHWRKAISRREVPIVRLGRSVRIPREFIEKMIKQGWENPVELTNDK